MPLQQPACFQILILKRADEAARTVGDLSLDFHVPCHYQRSAVANVSRVYVTDGDLNYILFNYIQFRPCWILIAFLDYAFLQTFEKPSFVFHVSI